MPIDPSARAEPPPITSALPNAQPHAPASLPAYSPADGLLVEDLVLGTGVEAKAGDKVTVLYEGTLEDGTVFDATSKRGNQPATFPLTAVIKGWELGVPGMRVGGRRKLTIGPDLAYGPKGHPPVIPPSATLIFVIDLVGVP